MEKFKNINPIGIQNSVLPLFFLDEGVLTPIGTGFLIGHEGLMMTATHVLIEVNKRIGHKNNNSRSLKSGIGFYALYMSTQAHPNNPLAHWGGLFGISRTWYANELDIGYCWLDQIPKYGPPVHFPTLQLSPGLPKIGENIRGFGYHSMDANVLDMEPNGFVPIEYEYALAQTDGSIIAVHPVERDRAMLPFPCFQTNARFDHGMSGGPIFNERGSVCGVICSSIPNSENSGHTSYGSLIWHALAISIDIAHIKPDLQKSIMVYDLLKSGYIKSDGTISQIRAAIDAGGKRNVAVYNPNSGS